MSGQDMRKIMENLNKETPKKKTKLDESVGGTPIANDIMELAAKLEAIQTEAETKELAEAEEVEPGVSSGNWGDLVNNANARQDALYSAQGHITKAMEFHIRHAEFGDEYLNHVDEAMEILYEILKQHNRL